MIDVIDEVTVRRCLVDLPPGCVDILIWEAGRREGHDRPLLLPGREAIDELLNASRRLRRRSNRRTGVPARQWLTCRCGNAVTGDRGPRPGRHSARRGIYLSRRSSPGFPWWSRMPTMPPPARSLAHACRSSDGHSSRSLRHHPPWTNSSVCRRPQVRHRTRPLPRRGRRFLRRLAGDHFLARAQRRRTPAPRKALIATVRHGTLHADAEALAGINVVVSTLRERLRRWSSGVSPRDEQETVLDVLGAPRSSATCRSSARCSPRRAGSENGLGLWPTSTPESRRCGNWWGGRVESWPLRGRTTC